jgi:hypothetical protein
MSVEVSGAGIGSGSPTKSSLSIICLRYRWLPEGPELLLEGVRSPISLQFLFPDLVKQ